MSTADELLKLNALLEKGVLTKEEFDEQKSALLSKQEKTEQNAPKQDEEEYDFDESKIIYTPLPEKYKKKRIICIALSIVFFLSSMIPIVMLINNIDQIKQYKTEANSYKAKWDLYYDYAYDYAEGQNAVSDYLYNNNITKYNSRYDPYECAENYAIEQFKKEGLTKKWEAVKSTIYKHTISCVFDAGLIAFALSAGLIALFLANIFRKNDKAFSESDISIIYDSYEKTGKSILYKNKKDWTDKFAEIKKSKNLKKFNISAFFLNSFWLIVKKDIKAGILCLLAQTAAALSVIVGITLLKCHIPYEYMETCKSYSIILFIIAFIIFVFINIIVGFYGNYLYMKKIDEIYEKSKNKDGELKFAFLRKKAKQINSILASLILALLSAGCVTTAFLYYNSHSSSLYKIISSLSLR